MKLRENDFLDHLAGSDLTETQTAIIAVWFLQKKNGDKEVLLDDALSLITTGGVRNISNPARTKKLVREHSSVRAFGRERAKILRKNVQIFDEQYGDFFSNPLIDREHAPVFSNLNETDLNNAAEMSDLYYRLHCFENSVRCFMELELKRFYGDAWWEKARNSSEKRKHENRIDAEKKQKWLPSRTDLGPLYSMDWIDLVAIMKRRWDEVFKDPIGDENFVHRFSDLYGVRNLIAHHGVVDDKKTLQRISMAMSDWADQIS